MTGTMTWHERFEPSPQRARDARRLVREWCESVGYADLVDVVEVCASEVVTNAVLHARTEFEVVASELDGGVRIEVIDESNEQPVATLPSAVGDLDDESLTGRGLHLLDSLATRWGVVERPDGKAVWFDVRRDPQDVPDRPSLVSVVILDAPVRAAVASGRHVDDLVRELQFATSDGDPVLAQLLPGLHDRLDRSAPARLAGREAALAAASAGAARFDLVAEVPVEALVAMTELNELLDVVGAHVDVNGLAGTPPESVRAFRAWVREESMRQVAGEAPRRCPLPD